MNRYLTGSLLIVAAAGACKDGPTPPPIAGPPAMIAVVSGDNQQAPANTTLANPPRVVVRDAAGIGVPNQQVTFEVVAGGGSISGSATATTDANGMATAPAWRLGKSNVPQILRATHGTWSQDITARIQTNYNIEVRFFGSPLSPAQQAMFAAASERLEGIITGDLSPVNASNVEISSDSTCGVTGEPNLNEVIDDIIIYAAIDSIDGDRNILAQAGPCFVRVAAGGGFPVVGVMFFDEMDLDDLTQGGSLQDVITHEMMHVIGFGTIWQDKNLLNGAGTADPRFTGAQARAGCQAVGGTVSCVSSVPVEGNTAPPGTRDGHWREATFNTELMTGFIDVGTLPISSITVGQFADIGYIVNSADNDAYQIFVGALRSDASVSALRRDGWEKVLRPKRMISPDGRTEKVVARVK